MIFEINKYSLAFLLFLGVTCMIQLRVNFNIAIVEMTSNKTLTVNNTTITQLPEFNWDSKTVGFVSSTFYYGYLFSPLAGYLSGRWGGVKSFGISMLINAIISILTPLNLRLSNYLFSFSRMISGFAQIWCYTSISDIWSKWALPSEKSKFLSSSFTGYYVGEVISNSLCGHLAYHYGWRHIFYVTGGINLVYGIIWVLLVNKDSPNSIQTKLISNPKMSCPWTKLFLSKTVLALYLIKFANGWGENLMLYCLPQYIKDTVNANISEIGNLSTLPIIVSIFSINAWGYLIDLFINKKWLTVTNTHKLFCAIGLLGGSTTMILTSLCTNFSAIMFYLTLFKMFLSACMVIENVAPLHFAPKYPSHVAGVGSLWYTAASIIGPIYVGFIVTHHSADEWRTIFLSTGGEFIVVAIIFLLFATSEVRSWASDPQQIV